VLWSSKVSAGRWAAKCGLLRTPEEFDPPAILRRFHAELGRAGARPWPACQDGLSWVLDDPQVRSVHLSLLPQTSRAEDPLTEHRLVGLRLKARTSGGSALLPEEKRELLSDAESIQGLSRP